MEAAVGSLTLGVLWMAGILRRDERTLPVSLDQAPSLGGVQPVVEGAQQVEQLKGRDLRRRPVDPVVTLEAGGLRTVLMNAVEAATRRSRELGEEFLRKLR